MSTAKYLYIGEWGTRRVMTVVRLVNDTKTKVSVGFSVCRPTVKDRSGKVISKGDQFCKAEGRRLANERILSKPIEAVLDENERPIVAAVKALANSTEVPKVVRRLASDWLVAERIMNYDCSAGS